MTAGATAGAVAAEKVSCEMLAELVRRSRDADGANTLGWLQRHLGDQNLLTESLGVALNLPVRRMQDLRDATPNFEQLSFAVAAKRRCAVITAKDGCREFICTDPFDTDLMAWARTVFCPTTVALASSETFDAWLAHCESSLSALAALAPEASRAVGLAAQGSGAEVLSLRSIGPGEGPAVQFINSTLYDALKAGASDVHLEGGPSGLQVKFRLDGVLTAVRAMDGQDIATQSISRIKVMAQLDIAERRIPQDGRLQISVDGRPIDVRVSIMPSIHGEDAVLRILDRQYLAKELEGLTLAKLGFSADVSLRIKKLCKRPHGMLLVTGPTGSGKTTTLYAAISDTQDSRDKVITIEDPVEYQLPGVLQIPVNERKGLTFAKGLRSILRHDPDRILVGEIRDSETAQIAVQSSLTGHLVFTTVHANTVFDVVSRFEQFGIDAYTFSSSVNAILAQRLLRRLCPVCATPADEQRVRAVAQRLSDLAAGSADDGSAERRFMQPVGCEACRGTGYSGRFAVAELLVMGPTVRSLIVDRAPASKVQEEAQCHGWRSLERQALEAVCAGVTTVEEVDRVAA